MARAQNLVKQASAAGLKPATDFFITPGSEQIRATLERDEISSTFTEAGGIVLANACGWVLFVLFLSYSRFTVPSSFIICSPHPTYSCPKYNLYL